MSHLFLIKQTSSVTYNSVAEKCLQHPRIAYNVEFQSAECDIKGAMFHNNFLQNSQHSAKGYSKNRSHLSYDCRQCFLYLTLKVSREENQYSCGQQRSCLYTLDAMMIPSLQQGRYNKEGMLKTIYPCLRFLKQACGREIDCVCTALPHVS